MEINLYDTVLFKKGKRVEEFGEVIEIEETKVKVLVDFNPVSGIETTEWVSLEEIIDVIP